MINKSEAYSCRRIPFHTAVYIYLDSTAGVFKYDPLNHMQNLTDIIH